MLYHEEDAHVPAILFETLLVVVVVPKHARTLV